MIKLLKTRVEKEIIESSAEDGPVRMFSFKQLLILISHIYGFIVKIRVLLYKKGIFEIRQLPCPVISIGNIVTGGSGKTPMAIYLAEAIKKMGLKPVVLSRGYMGSMENKTGIAGDGSSVLLGPDKAGDEPHMMAKRCSFPVVIGKDRFKSGMTAINAFHPDIIILDDGFQHIGLHRDLNIALLDCKNPFGNGKLLPAGRLRENPDVLGKRADIIIFTRCSCKSKGENRDLQNLQDIHSKCVNSHIKNSKDKQNVADETEASHASALCHSVRSSKDYEKINTIGKQCFHARHRPFLYCFKSHNKPCDTGDSIAMMKHHTISMMSQGSVNMVPHDSDKMFQHHSLTLDSLMGKTAMLFSGIADNDAFRKTVEESGITVKGHLKFMDHHRYDFKDIKEIIEKGKNSGADIIATTEKDYARFCYDIDWGMDFAVIGITIGWDVEGAMDEATGGTVDGTADGTAGEEKKDTEFLSCIKKRVSQMLQ